MSGLLEPRASSASTLAVSMGRPINRLHGLVPKMRALYGDKARFEVHGLRRPLFRRLGLSAETLIDAAEDRLAFQRFGARG